MVAMAALASSASIIADLCIYILTWNVGTHYPDDISLTAALALNGTASATCRDKQLPDIYVIGLQEVNTKPKNQIIGIFQDNPWAFKAREHLGENGYVKVETEQLQGLYIMLFAQHQHISHINDIEAESTRTGFGGLWGNKGAVSIRLSLYGTGVTFVNAHLAAHEGKVDERIADYNQIVENHHYKVARYRNIFDHDAVIWFGDLNFRLRDEQSAWDIRGEVERGNIAPLFQRDELTLVRKAGQAFATLEEQVPEFAPTFKFIEGTSEYDLKRRPAWCDRVLYRVQADKYPGIKLSMTTLAYDSHPEYTMSDHKPVSAVFQYSIETETQTDEELYELTHGGGESIYVSVIILSISALVHLV